MSEVQTVSPDQYRAICEMLDRARELNERSLNPHIDLARKIELKRKAKALREQAAAIGNSAKEAS